MGRPDVATNRSGNASVMTSFSARAYDGGGVALGPPVTLGPLSGAFNLVDIRVVGHTEGGFFAMRSSATRPASRASRSARPARRSVATARSRRRARSATPARATATARRTRAAPIAACRTAVTVRPTATRQCDDGNADNCDGCTELCELEVGTTCGDGVAGAAGAASNATTPTRDAGDGCSATCKVERILGGGKPDTDCYAAWRIDNPSNDPRFDKRGGVNPKQRCQDNDPACDSTGESPARARSILPSA